MISTMNFQQNMTSLQQTIMESVLNEQNIVIRHDAVLFRLHEGHTLDPSFSF